MTYDQRSPSSILKFAEALKGKTLKEVCGLEIQEHSYGGKGNFGQLLEKFYFGYEPNSVAEPDFEEAGVELKTTPLKILKNGEYRSKERLVLNIINYLQVHDEEFRESTFWKKNAHILLVFYLPLPDQDLLDYLISLVGEWKFPPQDLKIIEQDWMTIHAKIKAGKAHEISEGDTFYLGACTKGKKGGNLREQPFCDIKAQQRAYSLKQGYVNHIIATIAKDEKGSYGKILDHAKILELEERSLEEIIISQFQPFYGKEPLEIEKDLEVELNKNSKNYFANLTKAILGVASNEDIEEFRKADIEVKTVRLSEAGLPKEHISFPNFKYTEIVQEEWLDSQLKETLEKKFLFIFYQYEGGKLVLRKVRFWNMNSSDISEMKDVWEQTQKTVKEGKIVRAIQNGRRSTYFPKGTENRVGHVRPHARDSDDTYPLPVKDRLTELEEYTKHCFWLNAQYVKEEIYT